MKGKAISRWFPPSSRNFPSVRFQTMAGRKGARRPPAQKKPPLTHFLCIPLVNSTSQSQLEASLARFQNEVLSPDAAPVLPAKAIRPLGSLHCTLGVMSLSQDKLSDAIDYLKGEEVVELLKIPSGGSTQSNQTSNELPTTDSRLVEPPKAENPADPIVIHLKGLASMHPQRETSVLYAPPDDETGRLYPLCVALQKLFKEKGFLLEDNRQLKLHATIVNTVHAKARKPTAGRDGKLFQPNPKAESSSSAQNTLESRPPVSVGRAAGYGPNANALLKIDATAMLEKYQDFVWAENVVLDRVAICEMGAKPIFDAEGKEIGAEYTEVAKIGLPGASNAFRHGPL